MDKKNVWCPSQRLMLAHIISRRIQCIWRMNMIFVFPSWTNSILMSLLIRNEHMCNLLQSITFWPMGSLRLITKALIFICLIDIFLKSCMFIINLTCNKWIMKIMQNSFIHRFVHWLHTNSICWKHVWHINQCVDR
jgi:hypothetical protein